MKYTKDEIENFLEHHMDYDDKGYFKLQNIIEIRVTKFKEALKVSKIFGVFMNKSLLKNGDDYYYFIYTKKARKVLKLHKLNLKTLVLICTRNKI